MPNGYGDGGGGPSEEMCERARRLNALRGLPALHWDQPEAFFDRLAVKRAQLPALDGEIYLEYHRGTFTTQSHVKSHFRALERALQAHEAALVATGGKPRAGTSRTRGVAWCSPSSTTTSLAARFQKFT